MSIDTSSLADPMPTILDTLAGVNAIRKLEVDTRRDDLVDLLERHAEHTDENGHVWIDVQVAVDLVMDLPDSPTISHAYIGVLPTEGTRERVSHTTKERSAG